MALAVFIEATSIPISVASKRAKIFAWPNFLMTLLSGEYLRERDPNSIFFGRIGEIMLVFITTCNHIAPCVHI